MKDFVFLQGHSKPVVAGSSNRGGKSSIIRASE